MGKIKQEIVNDYLKTSFNGKDLYFFAMKVKDVLSFYYVAIRGKSDEEGAVQRVLSISRIDSIAEFVLRGNTFVNTFVLNWTNSENSPVIKKQSIEIPLIENSAQAIDGQHRLAGLNAAMKKKASIGEEKIIVALCIGLSTQEAANIFLNINTEQRPVPKSLVYDLYGIVFDDQEMPINRATDIARELHDNPESPYFERIRFPGGVGRIELSAIVSSLKEYLKEDGVFVKYNLKSLENQKGIVLNFFKALKFFYDTPKENLWDKPSENPFMRSAGFRAAVEYLVESLLLICVQKKSFSVETMKSLLKLESVQLLRQSDITNFDTKLVKKKIKDFFKKASQEEVPSESDYEF